MNKIVAALAALVTMTAGAAALDPYEQDNATSFRVTYTFTCQTRVTQFNSLIGDGQVCFLRYLKEGVHTTFDFYRGTEIKWVVETQRLTSCRDGYCYLVDTAVEAVDGVPRELLRHRSGGEPTLGQVRRVETTESLSVYRNNEWVICHEEMDGRRRPWTFRSNEFVYVPGCGQVRMEQ